jgi:ribosomal protein L37AE/L43A
MPKSQVERDWERMGRPTQRKRCHICGSYEPYGPTGTKVRYLRVSEGVWECNYCSNQRG